jgi:hypothetical protein
MAFNADGMNCIAVGPNNLYIYSTTDLIGAASYTYFNTTNTPKLSVGDVIICAHGTAVSRLEVLRVASISSTVATFVAITDIS